MAQKKIKITYKKLSHKILGSFNEYFQSHQSQKYLTCELNAIRNHIMVTALLPLPPNNANPLILHLWLFDRGWQIPFPVTF